MKPDDSRTEISGISFFIVSDVSSALAAELASRNVEFFEPLRDTHDALRGFEVKDADSLLFGHPR
jgi:hypothetical protein